MKHTPNLFILAILCLFVFVSCTKDTNSDDLTPPTVSLTSDSNYLDKLYALYDAGTGIDTQEVVRFDYDNLKRLTTIWDTAEMNQNIPLTGTYNFVYQGADSLPYKSTSIHADAYNRDTLITFHYYDVTGKKIKDSIISSSLYLSGPDYSQSKKVINYSYAPGKIYGYTIETSIQPTAAVTYQRDTAIVDANNNIISNKKYNLVNSVSQLAVISNCTYDDHPGAYRNIIAIIAQRQFPPYTFGLGYFNNPLTEDHNVLLPNPYDENSTFTYTYNASGYPTLVNELYVGLPSQTIYTYKTL